MSKITNEIRLAYGSTLMDDGYTLWNDGNTRLEGFIVGGVAHESMCDRNHAIDFARLFVEYQSIVKCENLFRVDLNENLNIGMGTWVHQGQIHFDVVELCDTEEEAIAIATERGEKAYYDIANSKSIYINNQ